MRGLWISARILQSCNACCCRAVYSYPAVPKLQCLQHRISLHNQVLTGLINVMFASVFHVFRENGYREKAKGDKYDAFTFMVVDMLKFGEFCEFT